jgi:hypothetical protein
MRLLVHLSHLRFGRREKGFGLGSIFTICVSLVVGSIPGAEVEREDVYVRRGTPPFASVLRIIEPGLPVIRVLQLAGSPTCRTPIHDGERFVWSFSGGANEQCTPGDHDLVAIVRNDRIVRFVPEWRFTAGVTNQSELEAFRRSYGVR